MKQKAQTPLGTCAWAWTRWRDELRLVPIIWDDKEVVPPNGQAEQCFRSTKQGFVYGGASALNRRKRD
jgi:hypothetical protein